MRYLVLCVILACVPSHAVAEEWSQDTIQVCLEKASKRWGVPARLVRAVMEVESSSHPWTVNISGKDYYPKKSQDALRLVESALSQGKSVDVGLMQINGYWMRKLGLTPDIVLDPAVNLILGAWILAQEIKRYGYNWKAIGSYHTPAWRNPERAKKYATRVYKRVGGVEK